jgi:hypothetical protein
MLKLAKHVVVVIVVAVATSAPVVAHAQTPSFNFTHMAVTYTAQSNDGSSTAKPR